MRETMTKAFYLSICFEYPPTRQTTAASRYYHTTETGQDLTEKLNYQMELMFSEAITKFCRASDIPDCLKFSDFRILSRNISRIE